MQMHKQPKLHKTNKVQYLMGAKTSRTKMSIRDMVKMHRQQMDSMPHQPLVIPQVLELTHSEAAKAVHMRTENTRDPSPHMRTQCHIPILKAITTMHIMVTYSLKTCIMVRYLSIYHGSTLHSFGIITLLSSPPHAKPFQRFTGWNWSDQRFSTKSVNAVFNVHNPLKSVFNVHNPLNTVFNVQNLLNFAFSVQNPLNKIVILI